MSVFLVRHKEAAADGRTFYYARADRCESCGYLCPPCGFAWTKQKKDVQLFASQEEAEKAIRMRSSRNVEIVRVTWGVRNTEAHEAVLGENVRYLKTWTPGGMADWTHERAAAFRFDTAAERDAAIARWTWKPKRVRFLKVVST